MKKIILPFTVLALTLTACTKQSPEQTKQNDTSVQATSSVSTPEKPNQSSQNHTASAVKSTQNAQNSLNWQGKYKGLLPCADCSGIETVLKLNSDHTYELDEKYQDDRTTHNKYITKGKFEFDKTGTIITLDKAAGNRQYLIGKNHIEELSTDGTKKVGSLEAFYILTKVAG